MHAILYHFFFLCSPVLGFAHAGSNDGLAP